jgi:hypothetical protein
MADPVEQERRARALEADGKWEELAGTLGELINLTAHEDGPLPCLCKRCLQPTLVSCEHGDGRYRRGFSIEQGRVLYFWMPEEIADRAISVARSVREAMKIRLRESARAQKQRRGR